MPDVIFPGPTGRLEGRYSPSKTEGAPVALILHGHPKAGCTMSDRVAVQLFQIFTRFEFSVLRFNFRGVGRSQGQFDNGIGELSDAASALDWLQSLNPNAPKTWVAGFSFGGYIAMQLLMRRPEIEGFLAISPPANHYDLSFLAPCPASGLILYGTADTVAPSADVERVVSRIRTQKNIKVEHEAVEGADHFYREHLAEVETRSLAYLVKRLKRQPMPKPVAAGG